MAAKFEHVLRDRQPTAFGNADLFADKVKARDHFGHRMFDLDAGVHFDEIEFAIFPEKLDRAGTAIAHIGHRLGNDPAHARAFFSGDDRRRRFLQHLLVAALQRTVALTQMDGIAFAIAEYLKFDVARIAEIFFDIDGRIAEGGLCLAARPAASAFPALRGCCTTFMPRPPPPDAALMITG
jgi:hypothetical protein